MPPQNDAFPPSTKVVVDSMVLLHFSFVGKLDNFIEWLRTCLCVTPIVIKEVKDVSEKQPCFGTMDLQPFIDKGWLNLEKMESDEETMLFYGYHNHRFEKKIFNKGEASCLAVSIAKQYGMICDEKEVLNEFRLIMKQKKFLAPAWTSFEVVNLVAKAGLITKEEADEIKLGFMHS